MPHNRGTRHKPKWAGVVSYKGRRKWVGASSMEAYDAARGKARDELREQVDNPGRREVPTVLEFAGAEIHDDGRITMTWPDGQRAQKESWPQRLKHPTSARRLATVHPRVSRPPP